LLNRIALVLHSFVTDPPILAICDRCRAEGRAGEEAFAGLGDLLDFEPVPRKARADGWTPRLQRAFIAAVAMTGSRKAAADAVGKSEGSVTHLLNSEGSESFRRALEKAQRMAQEEGRFGAGRKAQARPGSTVPAGGGLPAAARGVPDGPEEWDESKASEIRLALVTVLVQQYSTKVVLEREARLQGRIVEADYYLRQLTWFEVAIDLGSDGRGFEALQRLRRGNHALLQIAETEMSRLLGDARRACWAELGEPERPEHPPRRYLDPNDGFSTEPLEFTRGGIELSHQEQLRRFDERHAADARAQIEWEIRAAEQSAAWRARVEQAREGDEGGEGAGEG
jgi:hypothetical protein